MSFLKTLFWIVVAVIVALFCFNNWTTVSINLWNGLILETKLPLLLGFFFLLGLLPPLLLWQATRYRLRRRLQADSYAPVVPAAPAAPARTAVADDPLPPAGPLTPVPPAGA
jgi:lipopolysaccharide assembly protein A